MNCQDAALGKRIVEGNELLCFAEERTIRGRNGELDLVKIAEFQPTRRAETRKQAERAGLAMNLLGASTKLMVSDSELAASRQNAKEHIDLAADLHCPFVRVFGGRSLSAWPTSPRFGWRQSACASSATMLPCEA
jgi:sugar phosphate isomerase/epimerase